MHSSRVGTRMIACVETPLVARWRMGMAKAAVLPVPVRAWPRMSTPSSARGISMFWMAEGTVNFISASARRIDGRTPSAAKASGTGGCSALSLMRSEALSWEHVTARGERGRATCLGGDSRARGARTQARSRAVLESGDPLVEPAQRVALLPQRLREPVALQDQLVDIVELLHCLLVHRVNLRFPLDRRLHGRVTGGVLRLLVDRFKLRGPERVADLLAIH